MGEKKVVTALIFAGNRVLIAPIWAILDTIANLPAPALLMTQAHGSISTLEEAVLLITDCSIILFGLVSLTDGE